MIFSILIVTLFIGMGLVLARSLMGSSIFDRLLAASSFGTQIVLFISAYGFFSGRPDFLDLAIVYTLMNYIGIVAVLKFFEYRDLRSGVYQEDDI